MKHKRCKVCRNDFTPTRPLQVVCSVPCAASLGRIKAEKREKEAKRVERKKDAETRVRLKTKPQLEEECRRIVQEIARIRDRNDRCISCELPPDWNGQWHGSHFRSHGSCSALQFHLWNIHKSCWICNKLYSGRIDQYRPRLVAKIGQDRVDWLGSQNQIVRKDREYLIRLIS